ncbi:hypothetical protein PG984_005498, partial [Apiospora sp. TS-2023a]
MKISGTLVDEAGTELPTRILDLGDPTARNLALLESKGMRREYCALSYCWGPPNSQTFLTTAETLHQRLQRIEFDALPKTFQDAVQITRGLGMRYLWIDGLCIIQGDKHDWETEAGHMGAVYENACLVIAASGSAKNYSKRQLTYKSDRLVAIRAYAMELQKKTGDTYDRGVFLSDLPGQLFWINPVRTNSDDLAESRIDLPSWTWASTGGQKSFWAGYLKLVLPQLDPVITSDKFHIDETGALLVHGRTIMCLNSDDRVDVELFPAPLAPLQELFKRVSVASTDALYLTEPAGSLHSRLQGLAYFDDDPYESVYVLPLMTSGVWDGSRLRGLMATEDYSHRLMAYIVQCWYLQAREPSWHFAMS